MRGSGPLVVGKGPVRTGVTAILPHGRNIFREPVKGAYFDINGCGGLVGDLQIGEFGVIDTPIVLTNTMSMGAASEGVIKYLLKTNPEVGLEEDTIIPIVSECDDSYLNDARGLHVKEEHVFAAIEDARETVTEGIRDLSVGQRQRVETLKALYRDVQVLVMDEPTAVLTPQEVEQLFVSLNGFKEKGFSVVFISHKLNEVMAITDQITVLRLGKVVGSIPTRETNPGELARMSRAINLRRRSQARRGGSSAYSS